MGSVFPSGGDVASLLKHKRYASPDGNDRNTGIDPDRPKRTGYEAMAQIVAQGGGTLYLAEGTQWGGPVAGQGIWLRADGLSVPGYQQKVPVRIVGVPNNRHGLFGRPTAGIYAGAGYGGGRLKPSVHIVGPDSAPCIIERISFAQYVNNPFRLGWDFRRNTDGSIYWQTVTSATRSAGSTTFTVTPMSFPIVTMSRSAGVVTCTATLPASFVNRPPWAPGDQVRVTTGDPNFPTVNATVTQHQVTSGIITGVFTYVQAGSDVSTTSVTGTVEHHGCGVGQRLEFLSSGTLQFPSTMYGRVTASTWNTVTVPDPYGGSTVYGTATIRSASVTVASPGQIVQQVRTGVADLSSMELIDIDCITSNSDPVDRCEAGPAIDIGSTAAIPVKLTRCSVSGYSPALDKDREAVILVDGGPVGAPGLMSRGCVGNGGGIRFYGGVFSWAIDVDDWVSDTGIGVTQPAAVDVIRTGNGSSCIKCRVTNVLFADGAGGETAVKIADDVPGSVVEIGNINAPVECSTGVIYNVPRNNPPLTERPYAVTEDGNTIYGRTLGPLRHGGIISARFKNKIPVSSSWTLPTGATRAATDDPFGGNNAVRITNTSGNNVVIMTEAADPDTWGNGSMVVVCGWFRQAGGLYPGNGNVLSAQSFAGTPFTVSLRAAYWGSGGAVQGWTFLHAFYYIASGYTSKPQWTVQMVSSNPAIDVYGLTMLHLSPGSVPKHEAYEYAVLAKYQPQYLQAGMDGTMEGRKLIAHGGLGVDTTNALAAGAGSGQLTVGAVSKYLPLYAADGTTIIGWAPLYSATVNP